MMRPLWFTVVLLLAWASLALPCDRPESLGYLSFHQRVMEAHTAVRGIIRKILKIPWPEDDLYKDVYIMFKVFCIFKTTPGYHINQTITIKEVEPADGMCYDNMEGLSEGMITTVLLEPDIFKKTQWNFENVNVQPASDQTYKENCSV